MQPEDVAERISPKTKALILNSPSNPTGSVIDKDTLRQLAEVACDHRLWIISDEAYESFTYDDAKHFSVGAFPQVRHATLSVFAFSKTYAMTGWRVGYAVGNEEVIREMVKLQEHTYSHASSISQKAALAALDACIALSGVDQIGRTKRAYNVNCQKQSCSGSTGVPARLGMDR